MIHSGTMCMMIYGTYECRSSWLNFYYMIYGSDEVRDAF